MEDLTAFTLLYILFHPSPFSFSVFYLVPFLLEMHLNEKTAKVMAVQLLHFQDFFHLFLNQFLFIFFRSQTKKIYPIMGILI